MTFSLNESVLVTLLHLNDYCIGNTYLRSVELLVSKEHAFKVLMDKLNI